MFIHVRKSRLAIPAAEAVHRTRDQIVPMLKKRPGFLGYYGFIVEGEEAVTVTLYDDASTAARANDAVRETVGGQTWISGESEVLHGRVVFGANTEVMPSGDAFVVVRAFSGVTGEIAGRAAMLREALLPVIVRAPGFIAHYGFVNDRAAGQVVAVSVFDTEEHAMRSHEQVLATIDKHEKLKEAMPDPPQVTAGQVVVLGKP